jgi:hypothetical protein
METMNVEDSPMKVEDSPMKVEDSPMNYVCDGVHEALKEFVNREAVYIYAPNNKRKLFTLEDKIDYLHKSTLSLDEYIRTYNLEYKWTRMIIKENFSYKQQKRFENSGLSLDEYIEKNNLYTATLTDSEKQDESNDTRMSDEDDNNNYDYANYNYNDDDDNDDNDSWGE